MIHYRNATTRFLIGLLLTIVLEVASAATSPSWKLLHSWDGRAYFPRGRVIFSSEEETSGGDEILKVINDGEVANLTPTDVSNMLSYGWYHIMLFSNHVGSSEDDDPVAIATVPACHLRRANFRDEFMFVVSRSDHDAILSLSYAPLISPLAPKTCDEESLALMRPIDEEKGVTFESKVSDVSIDTPGMVLKAVLPQSKPPPGIAFLPNPNRQRSSKAGSGGANNEGGEGGEPQPPPGPFDFVKRYWYVFVPLLIMNFMSADPGPDPMASAAASASRAAGAVTGVSGGGGPVAVASTGGGGEGSPSKRAARRGKQNK